LSASRSAFTRGSLGRLAHAVALVLAASAVVSAHRRDEYLQAARIGIEPARVQLELDLTPGIAVAESILRDIDRDRDGSLSAAEQRAYALAVLAALRVEIDGAPAPVRLDATQFPSHASVRRGEGTIRLRMTAALPPLAGGAHRLLFRNRHHPSRSVYLANALVPENAGVLVKAQRRDDRQTELTIDFDLSRQ
jgi:hypothetical protein